MRYRLALGADWIVDLGDQDKAIGSGADQFAPFFGVALGLQGGHEVDSSGATVPKL